MQVPLSKTNESSPAPAPNIYADIYRNRFLDEGMLQNGNVPFDLTPQPGAQISEELRRFQQHYQMENTP